MNTNPASASPLRQMNAVLCFPPAHVDSSRTGSEGDKGSFFSVSVIAYSEVNQICDSHWVLWLSSFTDGVQYRICCQANSGSKIPRAAQQRKGSGKNPGIIGKQTFTPKQSAKHEEWKATTESRFHLKNVRQNINFLRPEAQPSTQSR